MQIAEKKKHFKNNSFLRDCKHNLIKSLLQGGRVDHLLYLTIHNDVNIKLLKLDDRTLNGKHIGFNEENPI